MNQQELWGLDADRALRGQGGTPGVAWVDPQPRQHFFRGHGGSGRRRTDPRDSGDARRGDQ